ncbi:MAG: hypothetical protein J6B31_00980 [Bacteroidaceae bacterium]|nr:hypothetical protein [Bacteroidaceae bacterium]
MLCLNEAFGDITAFSTAQLFLNIEVFFGIIGKLSAQVEPFAVSPQCTPNSKGKPPAMLVSRSSIPFTMSSTCLNDHTREKAL